MSNYKDLDKRRETQRRYREKNREKIREYQREHFGAKYMRKWRDERPGQREKERKDRKRYYYEHQEEEQRKAREYMRAYYERNKEQFAEYGRKRYAINRKWFDEFVSTLNCQRCGESDPDCLEFHHPDPKGKQNGRRIEPPITALLTRSKQKILEAAEKCIVLCANCHSKEHARLRRLKANRR